MTRVIKFFADTNGNVYTLENKNNNNRIMF